MAIKLNWQDLQKRIRNGVEAQKVMLNWVQIRPTVIPPTPIYAPWIYHNASRGMITMSSDWNNWYTIADKNVGATNVYNRWDTLTHANCWDYFQRWNSYWFYTPLQNVSSTVKDVSNRWQAQTYSSSTFIWWPNMSTWMTSRNPNLWGTNATKRVWLWSECHLPSSEEWLTLNSYLHTLWITSSEDMSRYLQMPIWWYIDSWSWNIFRDAWNVGIYWSNNFAGDTIYNSSLVLRTWYTPAVTTWNITYGCFVRPFKDEPIQWWYVIYDGSSIAQGAWIFINTWYISISPDWVNWITIANRNRGASEVYHYGDTFSQSNCGTLHQRGNTYGFTYGENPQNTSSTMVDVSWYGNAYVSDEYIDEWDWATPDNRNLWSHLVDEVNSPAWFHIPSYDEWNNITTILLNLWLCQRFASTSFEYADDVSKYLKLPYASQVSPRPSPREINPNLLWTAWFYWSSSVRQELVFTYSFFSGAWDWNFIRWNISTAQSIRTAYNEWVVPDDTWTILYQPN